MNFNSIPIFLASKSPRRKKLLKQIGLNFSTLSINVDEEIEDGEHPVRTVKRLAEVKMIAAEKKKKKGILITADTIVVFNNKIIGKPKNLIEARKILKELSGNTHKVFTGIMIKNTMTGKFIIDYEMTKVTFNKLSDAMIDDYFKRGNPLDKAGAYGIQDDFGALFIKSINGCYYNVVGLPLSKFYFSLQQVINC